MTNDGLKEKLDAHRESTNPWAVIRELKLQLAAAQADAVALRQFLENEVLPRYREFFDATFGGGQSVLLEDAEKLLATPNPGAGLLAIAVAADAFCAETLGEEITDNGLALQNAIKAWKEMR